MRVESAKPLPPAKMWIHFCQACADIVDVAEQEECNYCGKSRESARESRRRPPQAHKRLRAA